MVDVVVGTVGQFAVGSATPVRANGRDIALFRTDTGFHALRDRCPHQGAQLSAGTVVTSVESAGPGDYRPLPDREFVRCPWHGWEYELGTGRSWFDPARNRVARYETGVRPAAPGTPPCLDPSATAPPDAEPLEVFVDEDRVVVRL